jgi:NAD(P)-dependent dehydrogenase (short-subunit alcohol dehydrogenase family)
MYTRIRALELPKTIQMNACCPGWVRTNMAGPSASKSVEEGVVTPMFLAISEEVKETGTFWSDKQRLDWV